MRPAFSPSAPPSHRQCQTEALPTFVFVCLYTSLPAINTNQSLTHPLHRCTQMRDKKSSRLTEIVELSLPPMEYDTMALWTELPGAYTRSLAFAFACLRACRARHHPVLAFALGAVWPAPWA